MKASNVCRLACICILLAGFALIYSLVYKNIRIEFAARVFSFLTFSQLPSGLQPTGIDETLPPLTRLAWRCLEAGHKRSSLSPFSPSPSFSRSVGLVDKLPWQRDSSNHFPPDVGSFWGGSEREVRKGEGNRRKTSCRRQRFHPFHLDSTAPPFPPEGTQYPHTHTPPQFYTSCLGLYPRRRSGQAVFTAEVIGVVWREPDPGPAKARDVCGFACVSVLLCTYACL